MRASNAAKVSTMRSGQVAMAVGDVDGGGGGGGGGRRCLFMAGSRTAEGGCNELAFGIQWRREFCSPPTI